MTQSVNVPGAILTNLVFELNNAECDKEGLILGRVSSIVTDSITDSNISDVQHETIYNITTFVPACQVHSLFDWSGRILEDEFCQSICPHSKDDVIGWYKLRRQSSMSVSLRERAVHHNIQRWIEERSKSTDPRLLSARSSDPRSLIARSHDARALFLLCVAGTNHSRSLHSADHIFMTRTDLDKTWCYLPLKVPNLCSLSQSEYRLVPLHSGTQHGAYADIIKQSESHFLNEAGDLFSVAHLKNLNEKLHVKLKAVCKDLTMAENAAEEKRSKIQQLLIEIEVAKDSVAENSKHLRDMRRTKASPAPAVQVEPVKTKPNLMDFKIEPVKTEPIEVQPVKTEPNLIDFDSDDGATSKPSSKVAKSHSRAIDKNINKSSETKESTLKNIETVTAAIQKTNINDNSKTSNIVEVEPKSGVNQSDTKHGNTVISEDTMRRTARSRSGSGPGLAAADESGKVKQTNHATVDSVVNGSVGTTTQNVQPKCDKQHATRNLQNDKQQVQQQQRHPPRQQEDKDLMVVGKSAVTSTKVSGEPIERRTRTKNAQEKTNLYGDEV